MQSYRYDALISAAVEDTAIAQRLKQDLEKIVLPKHLRKYANGRKRVSVCMDVTEETIAHSSCMICICTKAYVQTGKDRDIDECKKKEKRCFPVIYTDHPAEDLPSSFRYSRSDNAVDQALGPNFAENDRKNTETLRTLACILNLPFREVRTAIDRRKRINILLPFLIFGIIAFAIFYVIDEKKTERDVKTCYLHSYSAETCTKPATCTKCGQIKEGSKPLGHDWVEGICSRCGMSQ